jgi:hypothetical protein
MALPCSASPCSVAVCVDALGLVADCSDSMSCWRVHGENGLLKDALFIFSGVDGIPCSLIAWIKWYIVSGGIGGVCPLDCLSSSSAEIKYSSRRVTWGCVGMLLQE